jgi:hypothetical protein
MRVGTVAGVDVSRSSISVALLSQVPDDLKRWVKQNKPLKFRPVEVLDFLALPFEVAVLEPTGGHYSRFWAEQIKRSGKQVLWVGHWEVAAYRQSLKVFDKTDSLDAVALACYGIERYGKPHYFLNERIEIARQLRERYLELEFLNRVRTPIINRLRQQLAHECPELADRKVREPWLAPCAGLWRAIAGEPSPKWQRELEASVGLGLSPFSRDLAAQLISTRDCEIHIETQIEQLLGEPEFEPYLAAMQPFYFGKRLECAILSSIYPMTRFAGRDNPLGAFKLSLGLAQTWIESGDYTGWAAGGNSDLRRGFWRWAFMTIPVGLKSGNFSASSPELTALREYYQHGAVVETRSENGVELVTLSPGKGNQRLMRCCRRAATLLFRKLKPLIK